MIPNIVNAVISDVSPNAGDASLVLRYTTLATNAWFDAVAPFHPTAVGIYSRFPTRISEKSNRTVNIAILYASFHLLMNLHPYRASLWEKMLTDVGLDPK